MLMEDMSRNKCFSQVRISYVLSFISICDLFVTWLSLVLHILHTRKRCNLKAYELLTYLRSWALLEKLPIVQLLKKFPAFYGTRGSLPSLWNASCCVSLSYIELYFRQTQLYTNEPSFMQKHIICAYNGEQMKVQISIYKCTNSIV
jgi:hypothetical protein